MRATDVVPRLNLGALILSLLLPLFSLTSCKKPSQASNASEIVIGEYGSLTGSEATFGLSTDKGIQLAVDQANAAGGVLGKKVKVIVEDDRGDQSEAITVVKKLINRDGVCAILGEVASTNSLAGGGVCEKASPPIPMISPSSTDPAVTKGKQYVFRVCFTDDFQGPVGATFGIKKGWKKVAILTCASADYSKNLSKFFKEAFIKAGGSIVADETYMKGDKDFKAQLTKIAAAAPDAVYLPGYYTDIVLIMRQSRDQVGLMVPFFGGDGWDSAETLKPDAKTEGCFYTNHYSMDDPRPSVQSFVKAFQAKFNGETPDAMAITGYDAAKVLIDSIQRAGSVDPKAIRDAIAATKDFPGAGGKITIDAEHNARKAIVILEIHDGKTKLADTIEPPKEAAGSVPSTQPAGV